MAVTVTFGMAPFISVVDKAIIERASRNKPLMKSGAESISSICRNPTGFIKSPMFLMMWGVYAVTYATANSLKTLAEHHEHTTATRTSTRFEDNQSQNDINNRQDCKNDAVSRSAIGVFLGTTLVNTTSSMFKDRAYASMFGASGASNMPMITYGLWASRDFMVIGSSFLLPDIMSKKILESDVIEIEPSRAKQISQIVCPIATQLVATPIQLLGLDFYNRPLSHINVGQAAWDRTIFVARGYASVLSARIARIAPAYGIGGVFNTQYRDMWRESLIEREIGSMLTDEYDQQQEHASRVVQLIVAGDH